MGLLTFPPFESPVTTPPGWDPAAVMQSIRIRPPCVVRPRTEFCLHTSYLSHTTLFSYTFVTVPLASVSLCSRTLPLLLLGLAFLHLSRS